MYFQFFYFFLFQFLEEMLPKCIQNLIKPVIAILSILPLSLLCGYVSLVSVCPTKAAANEYTEVPSVFFAVVQSCILR